jgi:hypothetical protein
LNQRPSGYEPDELPGCSTPRHHVVADGLAGRSGGVHRTGEQPAKRASGGAYSRFLPAVNPSWRWPAVQNLLTPVGTHPAAGLRRGMRQQAGPTAARSGAPGTGIQAEPMPEAPEPRLGDSFRCALTAWRPRERVRHGRLAGPPRNHRLRPAQRNRRRRACRGGSPRPPCSNHAPQPVHTNASRPSSVRSALLWVFIGSPCEPLK